MNRVKKAVASAGVAALLIGGASVPAQAATPKLGSCNVKVTPMKAGIYKSEKFCRVSSLFNVRKKVSTTYFYIAPKIVRV